MKEIFLVNQSHLSRPLKESGLQPSLFQSVEQVSLELHKRNINRKKQPEAILCEADKENSYKFLIDFITNLNEKVPVFVVSGHFDQTIRDGAFLNGAADYFHYGQDVEMVTKRLQTLDCWYTAEVKPAVKMEYHIPRGKRIFDIAVSSALLFMLSPLFLVIAIGIKLTSKGPVFYASPRVGTGYKIFPFYKFRSMRVNADKMLVNMQHLNHYSKNQQLKEDISFDEKGPMLVGDDTFIPEKAFEKKKASEDKQAFVKIQNDPRITRIGHFIRKTSIDELPQLVNVLLGHMSIVGNRPLPLYEAEKLTSDEWTMRFMAPAGITGLWQVTERGKAATSEDSRKMLDIIYAKKYSMWMDLKILIKTPLAAIQQEKV